eukprot:544996_1
MTSLLIYTILVLSIYECYSERSSGCDASSSMLPTAGSTTKYQIQFDNIERSYIIHIPATYTHSEATPMIFGFPGYTTGCEDFIKQFGMNPHSDEQGYLSVVLEGTKMYKPSGGSIISWNDISCSNSPGHAGSTCDPNKSSSKYYIPDNCDNSDGCNWCNCNANDIGFTDYLASQIEQTYCIDTAREYALGFSNGGMMTHRLGCALSHRFAAIASFHGQQLNGFNCKPHGNIGLINIWGINDKVLPGNGDMSSDGWYYTSVANVQKKFAENNGCDVDNGPQPIISVADGKNDWKCSAYKTNCNDNAYVMECNWDGEHNCPKDKNGENFALPVVWNYFKQFPNRESTKITYSLRYDL